MTFGRLIALISENLALVLMVLAVVTSAISVVYSKHQSRVEFVALQKLEQHRDHLNEEWGRLLLEQSTYAGPGRIESQAKLKLKMTVPTAQQTVVIKP
jgi:cell division protein FtsL